MPVLSEGSHRSEEGETRERKVVLAWGPTAPRPDLYQPSSRVDSCEPMKVVWFGFPSLTQSLPLLTELGSYLQGPQVTRLWGCMWEKESRPLGQVRWEHQKRPEVWLMEKWQQREKTHWESTVKREHQGERLTAFLLRRNQQSKTLGLHQASFLPTAPNGQLPRSTLMFVNVRWRRKRFSLGHLSCSWRSKPWLP